MARVFFPLFSFILCLVAIKKPTLAATDIDFSIQPYHFYKETSLGQQSLENPKDIHFFSHFDIDHKKILKKNRYYQVHLNTEYSDIKNSLGNSFFINPRGTKFSFKESPFAFTLGFIEHDYGLSRFSSPLNYVDQKQYTDILNSRSFSDPAVRLHFMLGKTFWKMSYIPYRFEMPFPGNQSFWLPRILPSSVSEGDETLLFPEHPSYTWQDYEKNNGAHKDNIALHGLYRTPHWLWTWQYYYGLDTDTNVELEINANTVGPDTVETQYPISLIPIQNKIQRLGFGFRYITPIKWRILFENSISLGTENNIETETEDYIYNSSLSLEWGIPIFGKILMGVFQGFYGTSSNETTESSTSIKPPLRKALLAGVLWQEPSYEINAGYIKSFSLDISLVQFSLLVNMSKHFYIKSNLAFIDGNVPEILSGFIESDIIEMYFGYKTSL